MGTFFRFFIATPLAAIITIILFLGVYNQLTPRPFLYTTPEDPGVVYFEDRIICDCPGYIQFFYILHIIPEKPGTDNTWTTSEKAATEAPKTESGGPEEITIIYPENFGITKPTASLIDHFVAPTYPKACIDKGASGAVIVQFDITPEGRPTNIKILESADECFNAEVIKRVGSYKYQPPLDADGNPLWRRGVIEKFNFVLSE